MDFIPKIFPKYFHFIFFSSFLISFTKFLLNFNEDVLCLDFFVGLGVSNAVGSSFGSGVGSGFRSLS